MRRGRYGSDMSKKAKKSRTVTDKHTGKTIAFDSASEKKYYDEYVIPLFKSGQVIDYDFQKRYELIPKFERENGQKIRRIDYVADFWLKFKDGHIQVKDVKGAGDLVDPVAKIKRKMMYYYYPDLDFEWICCPKQQWVNWDWYREQRRIAKKNKQKQKKQKQKG